MLYRFASGVLTLLGSMCLWYAAIGQGHLTDSITLVLKELPDDSSRIAFCIEHARHENPGIAAMCLDAGKALAKKSKDHLSMAKLISEEAISANIEGNHLEGARLFLKVDSIYRIHGDSVLIAGAQTNTGLSYYHAGQYDQALSHYFEAYKIYERKAPSTGYSRLLNNLAMCYKRAGNPEDAITYYLKSIAIKRTLGDSAGSATTHHNLGLLLSAQGQLAPAIAAFDTALAIYHALGASEDEASSNVALGKVLMDNSQYERADDHLRSGYEFFRQSAPQSKEFLLAAGEMARLSMKQERWQHADQYVREGLELTQDLDRVDERLMLLDLRAEILNNLGDGRGAYDALREAMTLKDSTHSIQRLSLIEEMQARFSVAEKEKDLRISQLELQSEKRLSAVYKTGWIISLAVAVLIALLGLFLYRSRQELKRKQQVIASALEEKELLLKEIHHRVKNNLQIISSLLGMQSYQSRDHNVSQAMREGQHRVQAMALIHQTLNRDRHVIEVDAQQYVDRLTQSLIDAYRLDSDRITVTTEVDQLKLDVDLMIPIGLILNELLTNSVKYAFPDSRKGNIRVVVKNATDALSIVVQDNGIGLADPDQLKDSQSMGYTLVTDFCAKLKARLEIRSTHGTEIQIMIPHKSVA